MGFAALGEKAIPRIPSIPHQPHIAIRHHLPAQPPIPSHATGAED